jgi:SpoIID/LytB domain protein
LHRVRAATVAFVLATIALAATPSRALAATPLPQDGSIVFDGHGWGHGRGMGQYGAKGLAAAGKTDEQILKSYYSNIAFASRGAESIRVHVEDSPDTVVASDAPFTVAWAGGASIGKSDSTSTIFRARYTPSATIVEKAASISGPWTQVSSGNGAVRFTPSSKLLQLVFNSSVVRYYRGAIEARRSGSTLWSINELGRELYLYGTVPREMPASWPVQAVRAQGIAARSYVAYKRVSARAAGKVVDICATTGCQVYLGWGYKTGMNGTVTVAESSAANAAIDATKGKVMNYNGGPILAEYSSSTGGYTSAGNVSYLSPRPDPTDSVSPHHLWRAHVPVRDIEKKYPSIGRLTDLRVTARTGKGEWGGRVTEMVVEGTAGSVTVSGGSFRTAFGWPQRSQGLKSSWFLPRIYRAALVSNPPSLTVLSGSTTPASVRVRNTGTVAWPVKGYVSLATTNPNWRSSRFAGNEWPSVSRAATVTRNVNATASDWVAPGETAEFTFLLHAAGVAPGVYAETFRPYVEGLTWMNDVGISVRVVVQPSFLDEIGNMATNGSFEDGMTAWSGHGAFNSGDGIATDVVRIDTRSLKLAGGADRAAVQTIAVSGDAGRRIHYSGWNRSSGTNENGPIALQVGFRNNDGSTTWSRMDFARAPHGWIYREATAVANKPFHAIALYAIMHDQTGRAWFDGLRLADTGVANPSFETGGVTPWQPSGFVSGDGVTTGAVRDGLRSVHLGGRSGTKRLIQRYNAAGAAGQTMTLSAFTKTSGTNASGGQIAVAMAYLNNDGTRSPATLYFGKAAHDWTAMHTAATASKAFKAIEVQIAVSNQSGHVWVDSILVRENTLANSSFETSTSSWSAYGTYGVSGDGVTTQLQRDGRRALHLGGDGTQKGLRQHVNGSGARGDAFVVGGWNAATGTSASGGVVAFIVGIRNTDGSTSWTTIPFARNGHAWTYTEQKVTADKAFGSVDVYAVLYDQTGDAWFDGVGLRPA